MAAPTPPDCRCAVEDLKTSTPETSSEASVSKEKARPLAWAGSVGVAICRPFNNTVLNSGPKPRTVTNSPSPPERSMDTPVMRCNDSARLVSGSLPMSWGEIASTIPSESRLMVMALSSAWRVPVTTTSATSSFCGLRVPAAPVSACARRM